VTKAKILIAILVTVFIGIISVALLSDFGRFYLFVIILYPILHFILFPFVVYIKFIGILYPALLMAFFISAISIFVAIKNSGYKLKILIPSSLVIFICILYPYSKYLGESHIKEVAKEKYAQRAINVKINLSSWYKVGDFIHGKRHLGHSHGYIYIDNCKANWSFVENNFIKGPFCK
jgi:hypothetical protein